MRATAAIALNVFRESVRDKVLYNLVLFAVLMIGASYLIGQLTAGQDVKIIKDLGLAAISFFGLFIAVFIGIGLVSKEVERRSVYSLLAKPIERYQLVLGKYAGLLLTLAVNVSVMTAALYAVLAYMRWGVTPEAQKVWDAPALDPAMLKAVALVLVQLAVITAIAVFFSTFSTPILSAAFTFGLFVTGHFSADLKNFEQVVDAPVAAALARGLYWVLPNLAQFDVKAQVMHGQAVPLGYLAITSAYALVYIAMLLAASMFIFSRRDFKQMARRTLLPIVGLLALIAALLATSIALQRAREARYPFAAADDEALYITSGPWLRRFTLSYQTLAADVYWIRAIQHYGGARRMIDVERQAAQTTGAVGGPPAESAFALLYPLLDLTTSLDPRFNIAYRFGAIFLAEPYPGGPGRPDLAVALLQKGLRERPDKWEYMQDIGFVYYWWVRDYAEAARWFHQGSEVPGAPWWLRSLAATTLVQGGDRQSSRLMWESIRQSAENDWLRRDAERRLAQLRALDQIDALQRVVDRFAADAGQSPADWMPIVRARMLPGIPVDPAGVAYDLVDGRVRLARASKLFPLPTEPSPMVAPRS